MDFSRVLMMPKANQINQKHVMTRSNAHLWQGVAEASAGLPDAGIQPQYKHIVSQVVSADATFVPLEIKVSVKQMRERTQNIEWNGE